MFETRDLNVLFVDDDRQLREANRQTFDLAGIAVETLSDAEAALARITPDFAGVIVSDIRMPRIDGLQLLARVKQIDAEIPVILITGHGDVPMAVAALHDGAFDFIAKPFAADHLVASTRRAIETRRLVLDNRRLRDAARIAEESHPLIGESAVMRRLRDAIAEIARADFDVLVEGETGTGKELVALFLHRWGPRRTRPFVAVNCGALEPAAAESELFGIDETAPGAIRAPHRPGRIPGADRGTLFLDEIDSMAPAIQVKLLRVLEEREVEPVGAGRPRSIDVRFVAATKRDLAAAVAEGQFRDDLLYRLNVIRLCIPPLRERREDIPLLFAHFLSQAAEQAGQPPRPLTDAARRHLIEHDWPGNVRELRNFAFRMALGMADAPFETPEADAATLPERVARFEASLLREALAATAGDVPTAARSLGVPRKTLYDKLARHGIDPAGFRAGQPLPLSVRPE
jgi:two-component system C4-dicarboxylate transport response regulator DctD